MADRLTPFAFIISAAGRPTGGGRTSIKYWLNSTADKLPPRASPSVAVVDAQPVKCSERGVPDKGFDGHKQV